MWIAVWVDLAMETITNKKATSDVKYRSMLLLKDMMAANHSQIGHYMAEKHLETLTSMVVKSSPQDGNNLFKDKPNSEGSA